MPWIRRVRTSQPLAANVGIESSNPIARGLSFAWSGANQKISVDNKFGKIYAGGTGVDALIGPLGRAVRGSASGSAGRCIYFDEITGTTDYTVVTVVTDSSGRGTLRSPVDADDSFVGGTHRIFQLRLTTADQAEFIAFNTATSAFTTGLTGVSSASAMSVMAGRVNNNVAQCFLNGVGSSTVTITGTTNTIVSGRKFSIGARAQSSGATNAVFAGPVYSAFIFNRALSDAEIKSLSDNPWQIFEDELVYVPVSAGGATTHATSGDLVGQGATVAGDATNFTPHATSGAVSGQGSTIAGSAAHIAVHGTSGAVSGPGAVIAGDAARVGAAVTHDTTGDITGPGAEVSGTAQNGTSTGAGKRHKPILIDARGQIHEFATQEGANAFLKSLEPIEEKQIQAKAKRIVSAVVRTGSAFKPTELTPVKVISGPPELTALANMRAAILQGQLNALVNAQIQAEMQRQEDDELAAVAVMMMME